jgi:CRISPR-associated protein Csa1
MRFGLLRECINLYRFLIVQAGAKLDMALAKYPHSDADGLLSVAVPPVTERKVDGTLVGLAGELSVDIYTPFNAIADLKTGEIRSFHPYTAAGYALAIEAEENFPVDYGFVVYLRMEGEVPTFRLRYFVVGDELRREFLEIRDEAYEIVSSGRDPGMPARCPTYCPYHPVCRGGKSEAHAKRARDVLRG